METRYVIRTTQGYYTGNGFVKNPQDAMPFLTRNEAFKRIKLRTDWEIEEILIPSVPPAYAAERLIGLLAMLFLLLFLPGLAHAQLISESSTITSVTNSNGAEISHWINYSMTTEAPSFAQNIASGSMRGNGVADIVVVQGTQVCLLLSNGDGSFQNPACFGNIAGLSGIAIADVDQDGHLDIVAIGSGTVNIYFGDGTGVFPSARTKSYSGLSGMGTVPGSDLPGFLSGPFVTSFNGDGKPGIALSSNCSTSSSGGTFLEIISDAGFTGTIKNFQASAPGASVVMNCGQIIGTGNLDPNHSSDADLVIAGAQVGQGYLYDLNDGLSSYDICNSPTPPVPGSILLSYFCQWPGTVFSALPITVNGQQQTATLAVSPILTVGSQSVTTDVVNPVAMTVGTFTTSGLQDIAVLHQNGLSIFLQGTISGSFNTSNLSFSAALNNSITGQAVFTNTGTTSINPLGISVSGSADWSQTSNCPTALASNTSCTVTVTFDPVTVETTSSATLFLSAPNLTTQSVALNGTEQAFAAPNLNQNSLTFGNQIDSTTSSSQSVGLTNGGNEAFSISVMVSGPFSQTNNCGSVTTACALQFTFTPTVPGSVTGTATVSFSTGNPSQQITLSGTGVTIPVITAQPTNQPIVLGQTVTFMVGASGTAPLSFAWTKAGVPVGGNSSTLTFTPAASDNGTAIICTVSNAFGSAASNPATLTVDFIPSITPLVTQSVVLGQTATFSTTTTGTPPFTYSWIKAGISVGTNSLTYTTAPTTASDNGAVITVTVTNPYGSVSSSAPIQINFPPSLSTQPQSQNILFGGPISFSVVASGTGTLSYAWSKNFVLIPSATSSTYTYIPTASDQGAIFTCVVTNAYGSVTSSQAVLTLLFVPAFSTQPANQTVTVGQAATFVAAASGTAPLTWSWSESGIIIPNSNSPTFSKTTAASDNGATFVATVTNAEGKAISNPATLSLNFPVSINTQPTPQTVLSGQTANFSIGVAGTNPVIQWQKNGQNVGTNSSTYSFTTTPADKNDQIDAIVSNAFGPSVTSTTVSLTVNVPPSITSATSTGTTIAPNGTVTFNAVASGDAPLTWQWINGSTAIAGATGSSYTTPALPASADQSTYHAVVSNAFGTASTQTWTVNVISAPVITSQGPNPTVIASSSATFSVVAAANDGASVSYLWSKNSVPIVGATSATYITPPMQLTDNGDVFTVAVSDLGGSATATFTLTVVPAFSLNLNPSTQTVAPGATAKYTLTILSKVGDVDVSCAINQGSCSVAVTSFGGGSTTVTVTAPSSTASHVPIFFRVWPFVGFFLASLLAIVSRPKFRKMRLTYALGLAFVMAGCAGGGSAPKITPTPPAPTPPTPASATYTFQITGVASGVTQTITGTLIVN